MKVCTERGDSTSNKLKKTILKDTDDVMNLRSRGYEKTSFKQKLGIGIVGLEKGTH